MQVRVQSRTPVPKANPLLSTSWSHHSSRQKHCHFSSIAPASAQSLTTLATPPLLLPRATAIPTLALAAPMATVAQAVAPAPLLGGVIIGTAVVANLMTLGRVLGVSGAVKGLVNGERQPWRLAFILGLALPVPFIASLLPASFVSVPASLTVGRASLAGLLVGLGTALGNGCTSGHGICGSSRLSVRSMAFTATFMAAGIFATHAFGSIAAIGLTSPPAAQAAAAVSTSLQFWLLGASATAFGVMGWMSWALRTGARQRTHQVMEVLTTVVVGAVFSTGLALSEMTNPAKVISFLALGTPVWDPSLMLVMIGAIGVSILPYQLVLGRKVFTAELPSALKTPVLSPKYALPTSSVIDGKLILGAVLFGIGWGLAGMCPGPALVSAVASTAGPQVWGYLLGMVGGMAVEPLVVRLHDTQMQGLIKA